MAAENKDQESKYWCFTAQFNEEKKEFTPFPKNIGSWTTSQGTQYNLTYVVYQVSNQPK